MAPPYRVDHVGSLVRPAHLLEVRSKLRQGDSYLEGTLEQQIEIQKRTEKSVGDVVQAQIERGIFTITTGEHERFVFWDGLYEDLDGFQVEHKTFASGVWRPGFPINEIIKKMGGNGRMAKTAVAKLSRKQRKSAYLASWELLKANLPPDMVRHAKITVISPTWWHEMLEVPYTPESGYKNDEEYLTDIADALHSEVMDLYNAGCRNVQVDDPLLSMIYTEEWEPVLRNHGTDIKKMIDLYISTHNRFLKGLPQDMNVTHHMCRGNIPSTGQTLTGGYDTLLKKWLQETDYKLFLPEWDNEEKHGSFEPLKYLPKGKSVLLGLIDTRTTKIDDREMLRRRVREAAHVIAVAHEVSDEEALESSLGITTQCGFATVSDNVAENMTEDTQWRKIENMIAVAEELWPGWKKGFNAEGRGKVKL